MAKLCTYYGLCPLIDNKTLLGVAEDQQNGLVIVTLSKNISIKYKFSDQKQVHSWRTKEKFSSPVIYDKSLGKYVAAFNNHYLRLWEGNEEKLDKLKRRKFNNEIYNLVACSGETLIVFQSGHVHFMNEILENQNQLETSPTYDQSVDDLVDTITSSMDDDIYVGFILCSKSTNKYSLLWTKLNRNTKENKYSRIMLDRLNADVTSYVLYPNNSAMALITLWSDNKLFSCELSYTDLTVNSVGDLYGVVDCITCKYPVSMCPVGDNYLAMYGANSNEEGALLILYNTQFKVTQSKQCFKMFTMGAKIWCIDKKLLLTVGQSLAVIPFHLETEQLAALVGSHKAWETDVDPDVIVVENVELVKWDKNSTWKKNVPKELQRNLESHLVQGLPESVILEKVFPDLLEKNDTKRILDYIRHFTDVSEEYLVRSLKYFLNLNEGLTDDFSSEKFQLIDQILIKSFSDIIILPQLRSLLNLNETLTLINYISFLIIDEERSLCGMETTKAIQQLIRWGTVLLDANYQKFVLSKDANVQKTLETFSSTVLQELTVLDEFRQIEPLLRNLKNGGIEYKTNNSNLSYTVERIKLY